MADAYTLPAYDPGQRNPYLPYAATILEVITETYNIKSFRIRLDDEKAHREFAFEPGQVGQLSLFGVGESTFVINSSPTRKEYLQFSAMRAGEVTTALHGLQAGDKIGVRAPLGNHFPYKDMQGKDIIFIGGGIGMAPLRTLLLFMLDNRKDYGGITVLYGAKSPEDLSFMYDFKEWMARDDIKVVLTIDKEAPGWEHKVGLIPNVLTELDPGADNAVAVTCGPPIMIKFVLQALKKLGFNDEQIVTTLEKRMKCGIGICGRCNIGDKYVCIDGPVFTQAQLNKMANEM
ncbi:MAG: FAD/NAD(P)-binding protein [Deltaproteobacteria bacterium]|jgi:NAD(P)H-flavin reductase|nr:FAD/NAD(P)-binding protein [Deltaproteobacteria bacterium]